MFSSGYGERVYLRFDLKSARWQISTTQTPLFLIFRPKDNGVEAEVKIQEPGKSSIEYPTEFHKFTVTTATSPSTSQAWDLGRWNVDATLLERQGATWCGKDLFVQEMGGEDMEYEKNRERILFSPTSDPYVLWAAEGDCFCFENDQWHPVTAGPDSVGKPLLMVTKTESRTLHFSLWNAEGTQYQALTLQKKDVPSGTAVPDIKVIGAKSRKQWLAEIQGQKITFRPDDWMVFTGKEVITISTPELLDDYIAGRLSGQLLALQGIAKEHGEPRLIGCFYDSSHAVSRQVSASLYRSWEATHPQESQQTTKEDDPFLDEDDLDGEEDDDNE
jgi:hypothetical protein